MKKIQKEDLENLTFYGVIIGIPSYVEINEHKDLMFKLYTKNFYSVQYNTDRLPNGLTLVKEESLDKTFRFDSYDYYKFDNISEFCEWYLLKQNKTIPTEIISEPVELKRKDRLKEVREYVQQVLNIEYYKNFSIFNGGQDKAMGKFAQERAEKLKEKLVQWLEEEI